MKFSSGSGLFISIDCSSTSISSRIPVHLDEDGCPQEVQPLPHATYLLRKLAPIWEHGIHNRSQILCRGPDGRPYFTEDRELQWEISPLNSHSQRSLHEPLHTLGHSFPPSRTPLTGYHSARNLLSRKGPITRSPPVGEPCWAKTGAPSKTDPSLLL